MCGIAGFCDFNKNHTKVELNNMTDILHHRGPDDSGYSFNKSNYADIGLGHRRLSILDLSKHGHQPMIYQDIEIVYNGEVYNFKEIKKELVELNYKFESNSDTEVILKGYHKWGKEVVKKLNGMFSITIYDKNIDKIFLFRDRSGVKPLYYYFNKDLFMFSSELKSFHQNKNFIKELDLDSVYLFLQYGYIPEPHSIFKFTKKVRAGYIVELDLMTKGIQEEQYWNISQFYELPKLNINEKEAILQTEKLLKQACEYRMISDVPVGIFLSGGYDSTLVTALLQKNRKEKLNTFTIGFEDKKFNEATHAKNISKYLGTNHTEYYCSNQEALKILPTLAEIYDEPFGDESSIPTILVSKLAQEKVTVSLSADGGDELFAGYNSYNYALKLYNKFNKIPNLLRNTLSIVMSSINPSYIPIFNKTYNFESRYIKIQNILKAKDSSEVLKYVNQIFTDIELNKVFKSKRIIKTTNFDQKIKSNNNLEKIMAIDFQTHLNDYILTKVDRATMSVGLEGREPLLDYKLIEFVAQLPTNFKYRNGSRKWLLKEIIYKYIPMEMMDRPKQGFSPPIEDWLKKDLKTYLLKYLNEDRIKKEGIFDHDEINTLKSRFLSGEKVNSKKLWHILIFEMWYKKWM